VAVSANDGDGTRVYKVPVDGGPPVRLVDSPSYHPVWSEDGQSIIYSAPVYGANVALKAIGPDKTPRPIADIAFMSITAVFPYRLVPHQDALIYLKGGPQTDLYWVDLKTGQRRRLTNFKEGFLIQSFDITPDGKEIFFDRVRDNADIVMMDLAR
jgi:Tol biopolymer transport system component